MSFDRFNLGPFNNRFVSVRLSKSTFARISQQRSPDETAIGWGSRDGGRTDHCVSRN